MVISPSFIDDSTKLLVVRPVGWILKVLFTHSPRRRLDRRREATMRYIFSVVIVRLEWRNLGGQTWRWMSPAPRSREQLFAEVIPVAGSTDRKDQVHEEDFQRLPDERWPSNLDYML